MPVPGILAAVALVTSCNDIMWAKVSSSSNQGGRRVTRLAASPGSDARLLLMKSEAHFCTHGPKHVEEKLQPTMIIEMFNTCVIVGTQHVSRLSCSVSFKTLR
eukprot:4966779-Amphidinium_carterae.2